jgi:cyclic-di-GMP phosphodiesterase TipF (flagellum assembly factor)
MQRFADLFIAICIPIAAASAGAIAHFQFQATLEGAFVFAFVVLAALALLRMHGLDRRSRRITERRIAAVERRISVFGGDLEAVERRLAALETGVPRRARDDLEQVLAEVEVLGTMTRQVIETVADLEIAVAEGKAARGSAAARPRPTGEAAAPAPAAMEVRSDSAALVPDRFSHLDADGFLDLVRRAVDADRIEILLQPIVTLPQRKPRFYEAMTRLRTEEGEIVHPSDYIPIAEARGYIATLDEQILLKSVRLLRRLTARSTEVGVFLNLSGISLGHGDFVGDFVQVLEKNRDLCDLLVFEFPQSAVRAMGAIEHQSLAALRDLGFRFSLDRVSDLKISFQNLAECGFRYVKIDAERLVRRPEELATDIHPADLADYFQRFGMDLIASRIEREAEVVDVLDFGIRFGQGFLFSPPRPVRIDPNKAPPAAPAGQLAKRPGKSETPPPPSAPVASVPAVPPPAPVSSAVPSAGGRTDAPRARPGAATTGRIVQTARPTLPDLSGGPVLSSRDRPSATAPRSGGDEAPAVRPGIRIVPGTGLR